MHVAAEGGGPDVEVLGVAAGAEGGEGDGGAGVGVVGEGVLLGVGEVVEEEAAAADVASVGPVVDAGFEVGGWAGDVAAFGVVVECGGGEVGHLGGGSVMGFD